MARLFVDPNGVRTWGSGGDHPPRRGPGAEPLVRFATAGDVDAMVGLLGELFSIEEDFSYDASAQRRGLEMMLGEEGARCVFVVEVAGKVAGMVTGQIVVSTAEGGPSVLVEDMVVGEEFRGRGLGRKLMNSLERWAKMRGATRLQLVADKDNSPAFAFYDRLGWKPTNLVVLRKI
jgi:ribosomal protein S18 acetylase RimI-like enzyme